MLLDSVGQELGKWRVGTAYLYSAMSEASTGQALSLGVTLRLEAGIIRWLLHCIILGLDAGYWLGTQHSPLVQTPIWSFSMWLRGFSQHGGWLS